MGKVQTFVGFAGVVALAVSASLVTGFNPLPYADDAFGKIWSKVRGKLATPAPRWSERVDGPPVAAAVTSDRVVVVLNGAVEARRLSDGGPAWTRTVDWAVPAGNVVVAGRSNGTGFEVLDASTGAVRWRDTKAGDAWPYSDMVLSVECGRERCSMRARSTGDGATQWRRDLDTAVQRLAGRPDLDEAVDRGGLLSPDYPGPAPRLVGAVADRHVTVIDTRSGARLGQLPEDASTRVTAAGDRVLGVVARPTKDGGCRYTVRAWDRSGDEVWRRTGYDLGTVSGSGCEQRTDPVSGGGVMAATRPDDRPALIGVRHGDLRWTGSAGSEVLAVGGGVAMVRAAKAGRLTAVSTGTGAELWGRTASRNATVLVTGEAVVIADRDAKKVTALSPSSGKVLRTWKSFASVIGADDSGLILCSGRTVGYATW
jgi:hypothetical protein